MVPLLRVLTGYRIDLELDRRWWHRLAFVAFLTLLSLIFFAVYLTLRSAPYYPPLSDVVIEQSLLDFARSASPATKNVIPAFLTTPGATAGYVGTESIEWLNGFALDRAVCGSRPLYHALDIRQDLTRKWGRVVTLDEVHAALGITADPSVLATGNCIFDHEWPLDPSKVVRYNLTRWAAYWHLNDILRWAVIWTMGLGFVLMNLYYRVVLYVAFGGPRQIPSSSPSSDTAGCA
jgi:hypothetical protein